MGLQYKLCCRKGVENVAVDALSRIRRHDGLQILSLSTIQPVWLEEIMLAYPHCSDTAKLLASLTLHHTSGDYTLKDGV